MYDHLEAIWSLLIIVWSPLQTKRKGGVAALVRSRMNGSQPFERTIEQTTPTKQ